MVDDVVLLVFVDIWLLKKYFNLNVFIGVVMYLLVVIWEIVDLCRFSVLVIFCKIKGCMVILLCVKKFF